MTLDEFYEEIKKYPIEDYIVSIRYKYNWEKEYRQTNELYLVQDDLSHAWHSDWREGEEEITIIGFIAVRDVEVKKITSERERLNKTECCGRCKFRAPANPYCEADEEWICDNQLSDCYCFYVKDTEGCVDFEEGDKP